jgi:hypothetical protein
METQTYGPSMKIARLFAGALAVLAAVSAAPALAGDGKNLTVVELFTSQGCSSCPPAEAFLGELARRDGLLALEMHVDYWDYIGWKDPFATPASTDRQRSYNKRLGRGYVYTPQIVVDGVTEAVGSDKRAVDRQIEAARAQPRPHIAIRVFTTGAGRLAIELPAGDTGKLCDVILVGFDPEHMTKVLRGENSGKTLSNYNVVREMQRVGFWSGQPATIELPRLDPAAKRGWAVIVQGERTGPVVGAVRIDSATLTSGR